MDSSILNVECSWVASARGTELRSTNLLDWLSLPDMNMIELQQRIRESTGEEKDTLKKSMRSIMPGGIFSKRGKDHLEKPSGFIAIDIDYEPNRHLGNFQYLKHELSKSANIAYCGKSVSGTGWWALIPIANPAKHELHFEFIRLYFERKGLIIDPACKNVDRLRFYSWDVDAYFNHSAKPLRSIFSPITAPAAPKAVGRYDAQDKPVWTQYNETQDFFSVLSDHGWTVAETRESKTFFTRPGKASGVSAEYDSSIGVLYVFTSNGGPLQQKGYNPFQVYSILEHNGDFSQAARSLKPKFPHPF